MPDSQIQRGISQTAKSMRDFFQRPEATQIRHSTNKSYAFFCMPQKSRDTLSPRCCVKLRACCKRILHTNIRPLFQQGCKGQNIFTRQISQIRAVAPKAGQQLPRAGLYHDRFCNTRFLRQGQHILRKQFGRTFISRGGPVCIWPHAGTMPSRLPYVSKKGMVCLRHDLARAVNNKGLLR